jgi:hypothetical protein
MPTLKPLSGATPPTAMSPPNETSTPQPRRDAIDVVMDLARPSASSRWCRARRIAAVDWSFQAPGGSVVVTGIRLRSHPDGHMTAVQRTRINLQVSPLASRSAGRRPTISGASAGPALRVPRQRSGYPGRRESVLGKSTLPFLHLVVRIASYHRPVSPILWEPEHACDFPAPPSNACRVRAIDRQGRPIRSETSVLVEPVKW